MKAKLFMALLALGIIGLLISCVTRKNPPFPIYQVAIELLDQQGDNISAIAGAKTTGEVFSSDSIDSKLPSSFSSVVAGDNVNYFILQADDVAPLSGHPALSWKLKCKEIFGNEDIHTIESKWEPSGIDNQYKRCLSFELEGKTYTPQLKNGYWTARVVVNR